MRSTRSRCAPPGARPCRCRGPAAGPRSSAKSWSAFARRALQRHLAPGAGARGAALPDRDRRPDPARSLRRRGEPRVGARPAAARPRHQAATPLPRQGGAMAVPAERVADGGARRGPGRARTRGVHRDRPRGGADRSRGAGRDLSGGQRERGDLDARRRSARARDRCSDRARPDLRHGSRPLARADRVSANPDPRRRDDPRRAGRPDGRRGARAHPAAAGARREPLRGLHPYPVADAQGTLARLRPDGAARAARRSRSASRVPPPDRRALPPVPRPARRRARADRLLVRARRRSRPSCSRRSSTRRSRAGHGDLTL